ncbi:hypothetical protein ACIQV1_27165 [Streptomyces rubiginosohelvolus]|uniref:hypothetical protein n=1 Tax=Streptomyces rubiginosohelvolus TaxID=67362 RepID=UPI003817C9C2
MGTGRAGLLPAPTILTPGRAARTFTSQTVREILKEIVAFTRLTDSTGQPLTFTPRTSDGCSSPTPSAPACHRASGQVIAGHANINTTMGYNAIYPTETIEAHRAFIARRRTLRPAEEYRTPTDAE